MSDPEEHKVNATNGSKEGVISLLQVCAELSEGLPEDRRYDVSVEIEEHTNE